jgi:DNA-binding transcriptional LysR family regulator
MLNDVDIARADLNLLVVFETVLAEGHVGRAAARLNLTPSAVSHGLGRLRRLMNDPLFLRTPRGVVPTVRAMALAEPVAEILDRTRRVLASAAPFDPGTSTRRFVIGAPDGASGVFLPGLLGVLARTAPAINIGLRQVLPSPVLSSDRAWLGVLAELEAREMDIAVIPAEPGAARFHARLVYAEDFVIGVRAGHPFSREPTLERFCDLRHLVVSLTGDPRGFVDTALAERALKRRVMLTVPNFAMALAILGDSDLAGALPRRFLAMHGPRFGVVAVEPPLPLTAFRLNAVVPKAALMEDGVAWLLDRVAESKLTAKVEPIADLSTAAPL